MSTKHGGKIVLGKHLVQFNRFTTERGKVVTKCTVLTPDSTVVTQQEVTLHHKDQSNKIVGRHNAFKKAMTAAELSKEDKTEIWKDYRTRLKNPLPAMEELIQN